MKIQSPKPLPYLFPAPLVLVSCGTMITPNLITIAWAGIVNSDPPMVSISVRPERHSYKLIDASGTFIVNLVNKEILKAADFCGLKSGHDLNKFEATNLTPIEWGNNNIPYIKESPVSMCCKLYQKVNLGTHTMFIGEIIEIIVDEQFLEPNGKLNLEKADLVSYITPHYHSQSDIIGMYGFSLKQTNI